MLRFFYEPRGVLLPRWPARAIVVQRATTEETRSGVGEADVGQAIGCLSMQQDEGAADQRGSEDRNGDDHAKAARFAVRASFAHLPLGRLLACSVFRILIDPRFKGAGLVCALVGVTIFQDPGGCLLLSFAVRLR